MNQLDLDHDRIPQRPEARALPGPSVDHVVARFARVAPPYARGAHLQRDLGIESVRFLDLVFALEAEFAVRIDDQRFIRSVTVGELSQLVAEAR